MRLLILSPEGVLLHEEKLDRIRLKLSDGGMIGIHAGHHPLLAETAAGRVDYGEESYERFIELQEGILEVDRDGVVIYTGGYLELGEVTGGIDSQALFKKIAAAFSERADPQSG